MAKYSKAIQLFLAVSMAVTTASCSDAKTTNGGGQVGTEGNTSEQVKPVTNPTASINPSDLKNKAKEGGEGDESGSKDEKKPTPKKTGEGGEGGKKPTPKKTGEGGEGGEG